MLNKTEYPEFVFRFDLFDGEGGGDGGSGSGLGAEASAFAESIGLEEYSRKKQSDAEPKAEKPAQVEYGRAKEGEATAGRLGSDNAASADIDAEFAELIGKGGKYHDIYGKKVSEAIQGRFKNQADLQGQVDQINDALSPLYMNYNLKLGDLEGLKNAIAHDEDIYKSGAERAGVDLETYRQNLKLREDAERGRQITEAYERQQRQNEMFAQWEADAEALRAELPNFDLGLEIKNNEQFAKLLDGGLDVRSAFAATHLDEILNIYHNGAQRSATQNVVNTIQQRASRPVEAGLRHAPAIERRSDPSKLTNEDMDEILRRVEDGESFSF